MTASENEKKIEKIRRELVFKKQSPRYNSDYIKDIEFLLAEIDKIRKASWIEIERLMKDCDDWKFSNDTHWEELKQLRAEVDRLQKTEEAVLNLSHPNIVMFMKQRDDVQAQVTLHAKLFNEQEEKISTLESQRDKIIKGIEEERPIWRKRFSALMKISKEEYHIQGNACQSLSCSCAQDLAKEAIGQ